MRALVTGVSGFVGSALCRALLEAGHEVAGLTRDPEAAKARMGAAELRLFRGGVGDPQQIAAAAQGAEVLFHAAGLPPGPAPARVLRWLHVAGTENVLRAARHAGVRRVVHLSCADVSLTGEDRMHWDEKRALPREPTGLFAQTKLMAEELALAASDERVSVCALRPALIWGPGDVDGMGRLAAQLESGAFRLYGGGRNLVATTHIAQLCGAALRAAVSDAAPARAYYVTDGEFMEARELYARFAGALGLGAPARSRSLALAILAGQLKRVLGDEGAALSHVLARGQSALFDMSQAVKDLDYAPAPLFDERMAELAAWVAGEGGAAALIRRARPWPQASDVDAQVRAAGGD